MSTNRRKPRIPRRKTAAGTSKTGPSKAGTSKAAASSGTSQPTYLTQRQKEILDFIAEYLGRHGISPTHREIRDHFGYSSFGTVYKHLNLLQQKGYLKRDWNQKRGLELLRTSPPTIDPNDESEIPFLGLIAAGQPIEALPGDERLAVPEYLFGGPTDEHYVLQVVGESMIDDGIYDGDFVIVLRREEAEAGDMIVALVDGTEATLKRFYPEGAMVRLEPANPSMEAILVPAEAVKVQGLVVGLMRKY